MKNKTLDTTPASINSLEAWTQRAEIGNTKAFIREFGREPQDDTEVSYWISSLISRCDPIEEVREEPAGNFFMMEGELLFTAKI